jgi:hypothetical protein
MYIRWQSRSCRRPRFSSYEDEEGNRHYDCEGYVERYGQDVAHKAVLVEAVRINGKPRQRHIACLASFNESSLHHLSQRGFIWKHIEATLSRLGNRLTPDDCNRIRAELTKRIGKPLANEESAEVERGRQATLDRLRAVGLIEEQ